MIVPFPKTNHCHLQDPKLVNLDRVLDERVMADQFSKHLAEMDSSAVWEVLNCAIEKTYYRKARHCGILYRLTLLNQDGSKTDEWLYGRMFPPASALKRYHKTLGNSERGCIPENDRATGISPISFCRDLNMILWLFPFEPKMRYLTCVTDSDFIRDQVEANLVTICLDEADARRGEWQCSEVQFKRVKYMPGKRCVLRIQTKLINSTGETKDVRFYSKTYPDAMSRYHFEVLERAYDHTAGGGSLVNIPRPLLHLDRCNTIWQEEWPSKSLMDALGELNWEQVFPRIAATIAALHRTEIQDLRAGPEIDDILGTATEDGAQLSYLEPRLDGLVKETLSCLNATKESMTQQALPTVPIHGACRIEQMLIRDEELALVDLDAMASADPLLDIAEFIASLQFLELTRGVSKRRLDKANELFLGFYAERVPWFCDDARIAWYALAFSISKILLSIKNLDRKALPQLETKGVKICRAWLDRLALC